MLCIAFSGFYIGNLPFEILIFEILCRILHFFGFNPYVHRFSFSNKKTDCQITHSFSPLALCHSIKHSSHNPCSYCFQSMGEMLFLSSGCGLISYFLPHFLHISVSYSKSSDIFTYTSLCLW